MPLTVNKKGMAVFLNAFTKASIDVLSSLSKTSVAATGVNKVETFFPSADIYGTMLLSGNISGMVEIAINKELAQKISASLTQCSMGHLNDEDVNAAQH